MFSISQDISISGIIKDENTNPISYCNIIVIKSEDSTLVSGTISDEAGFYKIDNLEKGSYIIKASFVGYKKFTKNIDLNAATNFNITLAEDTQYLDEVEITVKKPTLRRETDRLIFNVESTSLTEGNVWELLKSTPGVLMMNDQVLVKNSSNIIYLINGRRVYLSGSEIQQLFSGSSANAVQSVEVITNPSAKYDAEGDAVLNIKMSKNLISGYNGSFYNNYTQGIYPRNQIGTSHFFKSNKVSLYTAYSFDVRKINRINEEKINFLEDNTIIGRWDTDVDRNTQSKSHNANINFDYFINDRNTFSVSGNASITPYWKRTTKTFTKAVDSTFSSVNFSNDNKVNIALNADYVYESEKGTKLSFNLHHTNYDYERTQDVVTDYKDLSNTIIRSNLFNTLSNQDIEIYTGQTDLSIPLKGEGTIDIGAKASNINSKSDITQTSVNNNSAIVDLNNSGIFNYVEKNIAGYANFEKSWESWDLSLGLRAEYTEAKGELISSSDQINNFDYLKWFPSVNLTHTFNESHSLGVGYNKRIERPTYSNLNPFKFYFNDNAYVEGNPNLLPTITQIATLTYTIKNTFTFEAYYRIIDDAVTEISLQDNNNNQIKYLATNLKQNIDFGLDFSTYTAVAKNWNIYAVTSIFKDKSEFFDENNSIQSQKRWSLYANVINYLTISKDHSLTADLSVLYISPIIDGPAEISSRGQLDFGLKKSFAKGKWVVSLRASDILLTSDFTVKNQYSNQDNQYYARFDNRWVQLGLRFNFGNTKLETNENIKELEERDRLKTNH